MASSEQTCHVVEVAWCMLPGTGVGEGECTGEDELLFELVFMA